MKILTEWLRSYLPVLDVDDTQLAEDLTLRGIAVEGIFELNDLSGDSEASLFDMDITTNRVDAMNHYGIAREAAAIYNVPLRPLDTSLPEGTGAETPFPVRIEATDLCGRFTARVICGAKIAPSDGLVSHYFGELGQKQISNAVDITNFVMLGMGHPTHAFDRDKIEGGIVVRRARAGEQLKLLNGATITMCADDLVVADEVKALELAGVMGGWDSMITAETKNIVVQAAWYVPATIRASSRRYLLHTDASHRFERGADFGTAAIANALVTKGILASAGGTIEGELVDVVVPELEAATVGRAPIRLAVREVQRHLGTTLAPEGITAELVRQYLSALGCGLSAVGDDVCEVKLPSWRLDLTREIDLIEEIARVYGYNKFANTLPTPSEVIPYPTERAERAVRTRMFELGYSEAISSTFASAAECACFAPDVPAVALENPLSEEAANLRTSLLPGMVTMMATNLARDVQTARLFEAGAVFRGSAAEVQEELALAVGLMGQVPATPPHMAHDAPFFEVKGAVESLLGLFDLPQVEYTAEGAPSLYEPGRAAIATAGGAVLASFGQLSSAEAARRKLRQPVYLAEVKLAELLKFRLRHPLAKELSRFQAVERDFSLIFPEATTWRAIEAAIRGLEIAELRSVSLVELFRDQKKYPGVFSMLVRTVFQSDERTLVDEELSRWSASMIAALEGLGGQLRA
jgi:phenylalanyl-tRNA synthetase beta chain